MSKANAVPNGSAPSASTFASGQAAPKFPPSQPLALQLDSYKSHHAGHAPPGTFPDELLPQGVKRPKLFEPTTLPNSKLTLKNKIVVSPMCQYSSRDGFITPYHLAHLGSFALHGSGTIMLEAAGVQAHGRITPEDLGIWSDEHTPGLTAITSALKSFTDDLTVGIQLAHAGRKASDWSPYYNGPKQQQYVTEQEGGWPKDVVGPSALGYDSEAEEAERKWIVPRELTTEEVQQIRKDFLRAADRAFDAGMDFVEIHSAHGYLLHNFLSPLSNKRTDQYGGSFDNRVRLLLEIVQDIRSKYPSKSVWVRVSSTDFAEHLSQPTWDLEQTTQLAAQLEKAGVDVLDCSGGGLTSAQKIKVGPAYQLPFAAAVAKMGLKNMLVGSVGLLHGDEFAGQVAEQALQEGKADLILLARGIMANPSWPEEAAIALTGARPAVNPAYHRVVPPRKQKI